MDGLAIIEPDIYKLEFLLWYWYFCQDPVKDFNDHVWSKDPTTNPGLYDSLKVSYCGPCSPLCCICCIYSKRWMKLSCELYDMQVYVPYCTSDGYSGRRPASSESGGYAFFGKVILRFRWCWNSNSFCSFRQLLKAWLRTCWKRYLQTLLGSPSKTT